MAKKWNSRGKGPPKGPRRLSPREIIVRRMQYLQKIKGIVTPEIYDYINSNRDHIGISDLGRLSKGNVEELLPKITKNFIKPWEKPKKPTPASEPFVKPPRGRFAGSSVPKYTKYPITVEKVGSALDDEAKLLQQNANAAANTSAPPPETAHRPGVGEYDKNEARLAGKRASDAEFKKDPWAYRPHTQAKVQEAFNYFAARKPVPTSHYTQQEREYYRILREDSKWNSRAKTADKANKNDYGEALYKRTRWNESSKAWKRFKTGRGVYNAAVINAAKKKGLKQGTAAYEAFMDEWAVDAGHRQGKRVQPHLRDVDGNIIIENRGKNYTKGATMSFADLVDNMDIMSQKAPRIGVEEADKIKEFFKQHPGSIAGSPKKQSFINRQIANLLNLERYKSGFEGIRNDPAAHMALFDRQGNPLSYQAMKRLGTVDSPGQYESVRRAMLTMMDQNPEFDLDFFMDEMDIPEEFLNGVDGLEDKPMMGWNEVRTGNRTSGNYKFDNKQKLMVEWNKAKKAVQKMVKEGKVPKTVAQGATLAALIAASGVANAEEMLQGVQNGTVDPSWLDNAINNIDLSYDLTSGEYHSLLNNFAKEWSPFGEAEQSVANYETRVVDSMNEAIPHSGTISKYALDFVGDNYNAAVGLGMSGAKGLWDIYQQHVGQPFEEAAQSLFTPSTSSNVQEKSTGVLDVPQQQALTLFNHQPPQDEVMKNPHGVLRNNWT